MNPDVSGGFRHEALLYHGQSEFVEATLPFIQEAIATEEPILVAVEPAKLDLLRAVLAEEVEGVQFADMSEVGHNPGRIIAAWQRFVDAHGPRPVRGIGEPIWAGRSPAEVAECIQHERLLNLAFADRADLWLVCPYNVGALDPSIVVEAGRTHPVLRERGLSQECGYYSTADAVTWPLRGALPEPSERVEDIRFGEGRLDAVRAMVGGRAVRAGLGPARVNDLVLAVNEAATNTLCHGGGQGTLRIWDVGSVLVCEVRDSGHITQPLTGRLPPAEAADSGRGLYLINHLCDLVQVRSSPTETVVRMHVARETG